MPVIALKAKDSANGQLSSGISGATLSIPLKSGEGAEFPQPYTGTCSSTGSNTALNDTSDLGSLAVGDFVRNVTDGSWAFVTSISGAPNSVTTTQLQGGTDNTWQSGDTWRVNEFVVTIAAINANGVDTAYEEVLISNRSTDTLTVPTGGRGYNSTTAQAFSADDYVQLRVTAPYHEEMKSLSKEMKQQIDSATSDLDSVESGATFYVAAAGSSNAFTGTLSALASAYTTGERFTFLANHTINGSATFNRASLGAKTLKKRTSGGLTDLASGDILNGDLVEIEYDGTYYQVLSTISAAASTGNVAISLIPDTGTPATVFGCSSAASYVGATSIAFDAVTKGVSAGDNTVHTFSHTCTGSNRLLIVAIGVENSTTDVMTGITYSGVAMTEIGQLLDKPTGANSCLHLFRLIAPATGANDVVITLSASKQIYYSIVSYTGCNQTTQPTTSTSTSTDAATSFPITSAEITGNDWVVAYLKNDVGNYGAGSNTTLRGSASLAQVVDSNGTGIYTLTGTSSSADHGGLITAISPVNQNPLVRVFDFDQTSYEAAEWQFTLPSNYAAGTVTAKVHWATTAASGDVVWRLQGGVLEDNIPITTGLGSPVTVTDSSNGAGDVNVTAATSAITLGGSPSAGDVCWFRVSRDTANAADTLAADARLIAVEVTYL